MTKDEALQLAAEEIQKKEQQEMSAKAIAVQINSSTSDIIKTQQEQRLNELSEQQEAYMKVYKQENTTLANEINEIMGISLRETNTMKATDNLMLQIELSNREDKIRASIKDEATFNLFNRGIKEFGREAFIKQFDESESNVYESLRVLYGLETFDQLLEKLSTEIKVKKQAEKILSRSIRQDKDEDMVERIAQRVAEILKDGKS